MRYQTSVRKAMSSFSPTAHVHHCAFAHLVKLLPRSATRGSCWSWAPRSLATDIVSHASSSAELGGELGVALPELTLDGVDGAESTVLGRMSTGTRGTRSCGSVCSNTEALPPLGVSHPSRALRLVGRGWRSRHARSDARRSLARTEGT